MTATLTPEAAAFLAAVRAELADLPEDDAAELLEDVEQHLAEAAAEGRLADLGDPAAYAAELRAAAGLPPRAGAAERWAPLRAAARGADRVAATRAWREVRAFAPELRPAWWVARGYLLAAALARLTHDSLRQVVPIPHVSGNALLGLMVTAGAVTASVAWGRRRQAPRGWRRAGVLAVNAFAVLTALVVMDDTANRVHDRYYYVSTPAPNGLYGPYGQIFDIYAYDAEGNPLSGVRLYDQNGNPVAPMVCDGFCPRLDFPLREGPYPKPWPDDDPRYGTPTQAPPLATPTASPTPSPTPSPQPSATASATPTPAATPTPSSSSSRR